MGDVMELAAAVAAELDAARDELSAQDTTAPFGSRVPEFGPANRDPAAYPLRLAFVGQYSAGKSTLIAALTGDDVATGAGVTTEEVQEYPWHSVWLVDTPGVLTGTREDHDARTREAYLEADLLVFVTTTQLLDPAGTDLLQHLADDLEMSERLVFVVNKTAQDNATPARLEAAARDAIAPFAPDAPVVLCDARLHLEAAALDTDARRTIRDEANLGGLRTALDDLAARRGLVGRLRSPLLRARLEVEEAIETLNESIAELETDLTAQRQALQDLTSATDDFEERTDAAIRKAARLIQEAADDPCELVLSPERSATADLDASLEQADQAIERAVTQAGEDIEAAVEVLNDRLEEDLRRLAEPRAVTVGQASGSHNARLRDVMEGELRGILGGVVQNGADVRVQLPTGTRPGDPLHGIVHVAKRRIQGSDIKPWSVVRASERIEWLTTRANRSRVVKGIAAAGVEFVVDQALDLWDRSRRERRSDELRNAFDEAAERATEGLRESVAPIEQSLGDQRDHLHVAVREAEHEHEAATLAHRDLEDRESSIRELSERIEG